MRSSGWISKVLDEVVDIFGGGTPKTSASEYWGGDIPWLSVKDFNDDTRVVYHTEKSITSLGLMNSAARVLDEGDVVISARGTVGEVTQLGRPMAFNQSCYGLRGKRGQLDNTYLYYLLRHKVRDFNQRSHGSVFSTITRDTFRGIHVLLPEVDEQTAIAATLSCLDDKIELNNRMNKTLEEMAQALFKSWFVDFDPVKAKMEGREPAGMDAETAALFPDEFEDSELGMIPKGWRVSPLREIVSMNYGKGLPTNTRVPGNVPVYSSAGLTGNHNEALAEGPCLIVGRKGTIGTVYYVDGPSYCIDTAYFIRQSDSLLPLRTLFYLLKSLKLEDHNADSAVPGLSRATAYAMPIVVPPVALVKACNAMLERVCSLVPSNEKSSRCMSELRDTLLPKLMSGEIRVPEAEDILEEVL